VFDSQTFYPEVCRNRSNAMKLLTKNWMLAAAVFAAFGTGLTGTAHAVQGDDNTGMLVEQHQGNVTFVSGGVGLDESQALRAEARSWPLALQFTGPGSDYLADVHVNITGPRGTDVLQADSSGPYMLVRLHPGRYVVHASYKDEDQTRLVVVANGGHVSASFHWNEE
jgi:hypothetical protein